MKKENIRLMRQYATKCSDILAFSTHNFSAYCLPFNRIVNICLISYL